MPNDEKRRTRSAPQTARVKRVSLVQTFLAVALICNDLQSVTPFSRESRVSGRLAVWEIRGKILTKMSGSGV